MQFRGVLSLVLGALFISNPVLANSNTEFDSEASILRSGYSLRILKPLPRRNSGCNTLFRNGEVLDSCDPNYGFNPKKEGVFRTYCQWNLNTHYQKTNSAEWLEPYFNPDLIDISDAKTGYQTTGNYDTIWNKLRSQEKIILRWIEISFHDRISGSPLGELKCYPAFIQEYSPQQKDQFGSLYYHHKKTREENNQIIRSGLSVNDILNELRGYIELIKK